MTPAREFRLGIIGGCMTHQPDIGYTQRYHRRLANLLESRDGIRLQYNIARKFGGSYTKRLESLLEQRNIDGVLLQLRTFVFVNKLRAVYNYVGGEQRSYILNPFLFKTPNVGWTDLEETNFPKSSVLFKRKSIEPVMVNEDVERDDHYETPLRPLNARLLDLNILVGLAFGLRRRIIKDELGMLMEFKEKCDELNLPLFILGSPAQENLWVSKYLWRSFNSAFKEWLLSSKVPHFLIEQQHNDAGASILRADKIHLNPTGHQFVAERLSAPLSAWIRAIQSKGVDQTGKIYPR